MYTCIMLKSRVLLFLLVMLWFQSYAQQPIARHISRLDGLPTNKIYALLHDKGGFMWLGTERGLIRYDGNKFVTYTHPEMNGVAVSDVKQDEQGRIWCQNFIGQFFYWEPDTFVYVKAFKPSGFYAPSVIDKQGRHYISSHAGIMVYAPDLHSIDTIPVSEYLIFGFLLNDTYHYFNQWELFAYQHGKANKLLDVQQRTPEYARTFSFVLKGKVYTYPKPVSSSRIYQVYPAYKQIELPVSFAGSGIQMVTVTNDSLVWISTTSGVVVLDQHFNPLFPDKLLPEYSISSVVTDKDGNYWVGSTDGGLFIIESLKTRVFQTKHESIEGVSFTEKEDEVYVATNHGNVYRMSTFNGRYQLVMKLPQRNTLRSILYDPKQQHLVVCNEGLRAYHQNRELFQYRSAVKEVRLLPSSDVAFAATGLCGIVSFNGLREMPQWKSRMKVVQQGAGYGIYVFTGLPNTLRNASILYQKSKDVFWVATSKGVYQLSGNTPNKELKYEGASVVASHIIQGDDGLVVVSVNKGLLFEQQGKLVEYAWINTIMGRSVIDCKVFDGVLYVLTEQGVFAADRVRKQVRPLYYTNNQEELLQFEVMAGKVLLLTETGLKEIPLNNAINVHRPLVYIKGIWADALQVETTGAVLSYLQNNIRVRFEVPWFQANAALSIRYKINNQPWEEVQAGNRVLEFFSLSPGKYKVLIKAVTINGLESEVKVCDFEVLQPFWRRWWFYVLLVGTTAMLIFSFYTYRIRQIGLRNKLLEENYKLESNLKQSMLTSIKAQMNPHFVFNALNAIQSYIYLNDKQNASRFLAKFSSLTRKILEMSDVDDVSLEDELQALKLYLELEKMRFEEVFTYDIVIATGIATAQVRLPSMVIQPFVENAIKHGLLHKTGNRELTIHFGQNGAYLLVEIDDNGIGRAASALINSQKQGNHKSFAAQANQKRLDILLRNDEKRVSVAYIDKTDDAGNATGTKVVLTILIK